MERRSTLLEEGRASLAGVGAGPRSRSERFKAVALLDRRVGIEADFVGGDRQRREEGDPAGPVERIVDRAEPVDCPRVQEYTLVSMLIASALALVVLAINYGWLQPLFDIFNNL
jgi:hypothetical protein